MLDSYAVIVAGCLLIMPGLHLRRDRARCCSCRRCAALVHRRACCRALPASAASIARAAPPARRAARPIVIEGTYERLDDDAATRQASA